MYWPKNVISKEIKYWRKLSWENGPRGNDMRGMASGESDKHWPSKSMFMEVNNIGEVMPGNTMRRGSKTGPGKHSTRWKRKCLGHRSIMPCPSYLIMMTLGIWPKMERIYVGPMDEP